MSLLSYIRPSLTAIEHAPTFIYDGLGGATGPTFADAMGCARECYLNDVWGKIYDDDYDLKDFIRDGEEVIDPDTHDCDELYMDDCCCEKRPKYLEADDLGKLSYSQEQKLYDRLYNQLNFWTQSLYDDLLAGEEYALENLACEGFDVEGTPATDNDEPIFVVNDGGEDFFVALDLDNMDESCVVETDYYLPGINDYQKDIAQEDGRIYAVLPLRKFLFKHGSVNTYDDEQECVITTIDDTGRCCYFFFKGEDCLKRVVDCSSRSQGPSPAQKLFLMYVWKYIHAMTGGYIKENVLTRAIFGSEYNYVKHAFQRMVTPKLLPRDFQKTLDCVREFKFDDEELEEIFHANEVFPTLIKNHHEKDIQMTRTLIEDESYALLKRMCDEDPESMPNKIRKSIRYPLSFEDHKHVGLISYALNKNPQAFEIIAPCDIEDAMSALINESFPGHRMQLASVCKQIIQVASSRMLDQLNFGHYFEQSTKATSFKL